MKYIGEKYRTIVEMSTDTPASAPVAPAPTVTLEVKKPKKPRSEAQKEATAKALSILAERREAKKKEQTAESDSKEIAREAVRTKKRAEPKVEFVTKKELSDFMSQVESKLKTPTHVAPKVVAAPPASLSAKASPAASRPPTAPGAAKMTGHQLLDQLFFK